MTLLITEQDWCKHPYYIDILVSSHGTVLSYKRGFWYKLKPSYSDAGYFRVGVGHANPCAIHRLVAECYVHNANPLAKIDVNHIDGNKTNNFFENLEWVTKKENVEHSWRLGLSTPANEVPIRIVETGEVFRSVTECARQINGIQGNISLCLMGRRRRHRGFTFEYADGRN